MHLGYTPYIISMLVAAVISAVLAAYMWQRRSGTPGATALVLLMLALTVWLLAEVLCLVNNDLSTRLIWAKIEYTSIVSVPVIWLAFVLQYTGRQSWLTHRKLALLAICPIITLLLVWTNETHGLIWAEFHLYQHGSVMISEKSYGVWFWVQTTYSYLLMFSGASLIVRWAISSFRLYRRQAVVMLIGALVPLGGNLPYILHLGSFQGIDPTPIIFTMSGLMLALGLFRFQLLDIIPVARDTIIKGMSDGLIVLDVQNRIVDVNIAAEGIIDLTASEIIGQPVGQVLPCWADSTEGRQELMETKPEVFISKGGEEHYYALSISPLYGRSDSVAGRAVIIRDITERKQGEKEKALLEQQFHQSQRLESVGRLAGGVAHDLNNMLTPILGFGEILLKDSAGDEERREQLEEIVKAGGRARDLVRQLLAFSRKQTLEFKNIGLNILLKDFEKLLRSTIREDITFRLIPAKSLPLIQGDVGQMEQVVMNLAVNAQDAMPDGGELTIETILVELDESYAAEHVSVTPGPYVMLSISDTGYGMDAEIREHIFEPFFTTKDKDRGTGLGLSTVYGIVKQHGGNIWVYSEPGKGTTFKVYLPVSGDTHIERRAEGKTYTASHGSETILLAEDDEIVRKLALTILEQNGYTVITAKNGVDALLVLKAHDGPMHLLLTDVVMPEMNGRELFNRVTDEYPNLKVLYMSGYTDSVIAHRGVLDKGVAFIQKPFTVNDLASKVREVLD